MTKQGQIYKCEVCGNIVEVLHPGAGQLVCCNQNMQLMEEKTAETAKEKHVPHIEYQNDYYIVRVGEKMQHPMEKEHYIEWIELTVDGITHKIYLKEKQSPELKVLSPKGNRVHAREYCNIHGLWGNKN